MSFTHNPKQVIEQLQTILSSPSKKIGFLFGAGISMQKTDDTSLIIGMNDEKITDKEGVVTGVKEGMLTLATKDLSSTQKAAIEFMKKEIESEVKKFNIETLLSKISEKERAAGYEKLCNLTKVELEQLRKDIEEKIKTIVSVHDGVARINIEEANHNTFAKWIKNANREYPVEIFTTNYDYLLELALEKQQIPYFDGFIGSYEAFFCPEWIESDSTVRDWVKLWKLHGSLGWDQNEKNEIIRSSGASGKAMIYPSFLKYDHSKKQPYLSYMDRLSHFLRQDDSVLFVSGYSFGDEHINEIILTSLARSCSSHVFILNRGLIGEGDYLSKEIAQKSAKISLYAKRTAVIGCKFGEWKLDREPDKNESYNIIDTAFDEDATLEVEDRAETWTGKGDFRLGNFKYFTNFLSHFYRNSKYIKEKNEK